ncbi:hypothetical protein PISMIDRAFT_679775 [Pisolithus microcarpus 441]|uniref:Uncharacterized protein n=1 Tax=Pisolithus microcarpus 441 TaxID=765257 RepID=A0A0C9Z1I8_9AGAM|nr:hypothetical protein PISMIDRAFT_679775 [Pisolithus microcarpus 441]
MVLFSTYNDPCSVYVRQFTVMSYMQGLCSIRLEQRGWFLIFFLPSVVLLVFSALSFTSALFRYETGAWSFLGLPLDNSGSPARCFLHSGIDL